MEGLGGAALHGLIQIGYALESGEDGTITDGLAYLAFAQHSLGKISLPSAEEKSDEPSPQDAFQWSFPVTSSKILQLFKAVQEDNTLDGFHCEGGIGFQTRVHALTQEPWASHLKRYDLPLPVLLSKLKPLLSQASDEPKHLLDQIKSLINSDSPASLAPSSPPKHLPKSVMVKAESQGQDEAHASSSQDEVTSKLMEEDLVSPVPPPAPPASVEMAIGEELINLFMKATIELYGATGSHDFFLLHGVTGMRSSKEILGLYYNDKDTPNEENLPAFHVQLLALAYMWKMLIYTYIAQGRPAIDGDFERNVCHYNWSDLIRYATASNDEHVIKLAYVCHAEAVEDIKRRNSPCQSHDQADAGAENPIYSYVVGRTMEQGEWTF